ncbi:urea ABC transporter ATP-binding protein UrtD [Metabacillus litoralis]|uniref:Urea ABC transporter ATP-binding protein UrtD n=1 Tax=Metabacillus litoralis TaxID=152268 RepID=A0A5C6W5Z7_9BACI|nr:urea ABC transporter ATP-binding protein UrtD [Metabacillus litoralis]TXC93396.1 urea ABC transporter ATP-binding protein UrtD [Metabacillus litoralis]
MKPILSCRNVMVDFSGFKALQGVDLDVQNKEVLFLIGPNGAGKTTLLDCICGKTRASSGQILFEEKIELSKLPEQKIVQEGIARKFQAPSIFLHLTPFENLEIAMKQKKSLLSILLAKMTQVQHEKIEAILKKVGLFEDRHKLAGSLSHGQKQWLEIGMQLIQEPTLLLLDEPIAGMSGEERTKTGELIKEIAKECTVVVVEHDMEFVRNFSSKVVVMHEGKVLCQGSMKDIQENEEVKNVYLGRSG